MLMLVERLCVHAIQASGQGGRKAGNQLVQGRPSYLSPPENVIISLIWAGSSVFLSSSHSYLCSLQPVYRLPP